MVGDVEENLENSRRANEQIVSSARDTSEDCDESRNQVERIQESVSEMSGAIDGIYQNTKEMFKISENVTNHTLGFVKTMDVAVDSMQQIKETANQTGASINPYNIVLGDCETGGSGDGAVAYSQKNPLPVLSWDFRQSLFLL